MRRVSATFLILLGLATLALGQVWLRGGALLSGKGTITDTTLFILGTGLLAFSLLGLGRILVYARAELPRGAEVPIEDSHD